MTIYKTDGTPIKDVVCLSLHPDDNEYYMYILALPDEFETVYGELKIEEFAFIKE